MPMNLVIQERRKALGLTQEQVAAHLHVSTPAVNKWEKGTTCPDVALLPALARLLKTDLNTLFSYQENVTREEISALCQTIMALFQSEGIGAAFAASEQALHEYPHSEELLYNLAVNLDGMLTLSGRPSEELEPYEESVLSWYRRLSGSGNAEIADSARYMLASRYIRRDDLVQAQAVLDEMPEPKAVTASMPDKRMLQVTLYLRQGRGEHAAEVLEQELLGALTRVQALLGQLVDAELASGDRETARYAADRERILAEKFDLWRYNAFAWPLQVAMAEQDGDACVPLLRGMLEELFRPWKPEQSPLFHRIAHSLRPVVPEQMLPVILKGLEEDDGCGFLREREDVRELLAVYQEKADALMAQLASGTKD